MAGSVNCAGPKLVQNVARDLQEWMKHVRENTSIVPTTAAELQRLRYRMQEAGKALAGRDRTAGMPEWPEWKDALASYRETLQQLSTFLREFDIHLRIRRAELGAACGHTSAASEWAAAVKRLG